MAAQLQQIEEAVVGACNASLAADVRQGYTAYCNSIRQSPDAWRAVLALLDYSSQIQAKFFALTTLQELLGGRKGQSDGQLAIPQLDEPHRVEVRLALFDWIARHKETLHGEAHYLRTKLAVVLALLIKADYPDRWPTAFQDLLAFPQMNACLADLFLRILTAVDDEIVAFRDDRTDDEVVRNTHIKDTMRDTNAAMEVSATLQSIIQFYMHVDTAVADLALETLQTFVPWVELRTITDVLPSVYECLSHTALSESALGCLLELINRGMADSDKVELLAQMDVFAKLQSVPDAPGNEDADDLAESVAEVVASAGIQLLGAWDSLVKLSSQGHALSDVADPRMTFELLTCALDLLWKYLSHNTADVAVAILPFANRLIESAGLQIDVGGAVQSLPPLDTVALLRVLLPLLYQQLHYSEHFEFNEEEDDDEAEEEVHRTNVRRSFMRCVRICPDMTLEFVCSIMWTFLQTDIHTLPFTRVEADLRLVYHFLEGLGPKRSKYVQEGPFPEMLTMLHGSTVADYPHWAVVTLYFEIADRYWQHLRANPALIGVVLERLCSSRGLTASHPTLRTRSCFLLKNLVKHLGSSVSPFTGSVLGGIQGLLFGDSLGSLNVGDAGQLLEVAALLVNSSALGPTDQVHHLDSMITPIVGGIKAILQDPTAQANPIEAGDRLSEKLMLMASLSKGSARAIDHLQPVYAKLLEASIQVLQALPSHAAVRSKFMVVIHRMVTCMNDGLVQYLPHFIGLLVSNMPPDVADEAQKDIDALVQLVNQLMLRYGSKLTELLDPLIFDLLQRLFDLMPGDGAASAPHVKSVVACLQRHYFSIIQHVACNGLSQILFSEHNRAHLPQLLNSIVACIVEGEDLASMKSCFVFFSELLKASTANEMGLWNEADVTALITFSLDQVIPASFAFMLSPQFRPKDPNYVRLLNDISPLLRRTYTAANAQFLTKIHTQICPAYNLPPQFPEEMCHALEASLSDSSGDQLHRYLRHFLATRS